MPRGGANIALELFPHGIGVLIGACKQVLKAIGIDGTDHLGQLPAILALDRVGHAAEIGDGLLARLRMWERGVEAPLQSTKADAYASTVPAVSTVRVCSPSIIPPEGGYCHIYNSGSRPRSRG